MTTELTLLINEALRDILTQTTPKAEIRTRQGRGGRNYLYTDVAYVIRTLNQAFAWDWDFVADHEEILYLCERPFEARCRGQLTVRIGERAITKTQFGCQPIEFLKDGLTPVSLGDALKGAASDALKKCASLLGIALDLYDSDSEIYTGALQPATKSAPPKIVQGEKIFNTHDDLLFQLHLDFGLTEEQAVAKIKELGLSTKGAGNGQLQLRLSEIYQAIKRSMGN